MCIVGSVMTNNFLPDILIIISPICKMCAHPEEAYIPPSTSKWKALSRNPEYLHPAGVSKMLWACIEMKRPLKVLKMWGLFKVRPTIGECVCVCMCVYCGFTGVLELAWKNLLSASFPTTTFNGLVSWNELWWEFLAHGNWQVLQISSLSSTQSWLLNIY